MAYCEIENGKIYYEQKGSGDPVIFIHGIALDSRYWLDLPEFISKKYTAITYDLRGHGQSSVPETGYSYRDHVGDLKVLLKTLDLRKVTIIAHSLGGAIAIKYALEHVDLVKGLFLAAPHVVGYKEYSDWPNVYRTARNIDIDQARIQWETFRLFNRLPEGSQGRKIFKECLRDFPGRLWIDPNAGKYLDESDLKILDNLTMQVAVLCGREDTDFLPLAKLLNARLTNGSLFEIPDCGHMIHLEKPEIFKRELKSFLKL